MKNWPSFLDTVLPIYQTFMTLCEKSSFHVKEIHKKPAVNPGFTCGFPLFSMSATPGKFPQWFPYRVKDFRMETPWKPLETWGSRMETPVETTGNMETWGCQTGNTMETTETLGCQTWKLVHGNLGVP